MYELSRVRLHTVGPKGARYADIILDLRDVGPLGGSRRRPSPATVLFLENGGGKSVLVKLIFSVMLPGRRQVVGTTSTRVLEKVRPSRRRGSHCPGMAGPEDRSAPGHRKSTGVAWPRGLFGSQQAD